ncbi:MAG: acylphosphatase [Burkholderiales bacterium]|jgi:acylphosphatase
MIARRVRAHGRVQGVGFRDAMVDAATLAGAQGWVRNRRDGTVEAWVQGDESAVERVLAWARRGPRLAQVERLEVAEVEADATIAGFDRAPTA